MHVTARAQAVGVGIAALARRSHCLTWLGAWRRCRSACRYRRWPTAWQALLAAAQRRAGQLEKVWVVDVQHLYCFHFGSQHQLLIYRAKFYMTAIF